MPSSDYENFKDAVLYSFKKRKTAFLMTEKILSDIRFQTEIYPKEDKERLDALLEVMRDNDLIILNQPKFAALSPAGKIAVANLPDLPDF